MVTKENKIVALRIAVEIAKNWAQSPSDKVMPGAVLKEFYQSYLEILAEIETARR